MSSPQLGQISDPAQLVPGDQAAIRSSAARLQTFSLAFGQTADGLSDLDTAHWTGAAADAFRDKFVPHMARWRAASSATGDVGGALESYADVVQSAQDMARRAIDTYAAGQRATAAARAAYNQRVAAFNHAARAYNARLAAGADPGPRPEEPAAFSDPGAALRAEAGQVLSRARSSRDAAAARAETAIMSATDQAPAWRSSWAQVAACRHDPVPPPGPPTPGSGGGADGGAAVALGAAGDGAAAGLSEVAAKPALAARSAPDIPLVGGSVDVVTGDVLLFQEDVSLPGVLPLVIGRAYRSSWRAGRWFGRPWASCLDQRLQVTAERVTGVFADGRVLSWLCTADEAGPVPATGLPVTGPRWRLERVAGDAFTITDPQAGLVWRFERRPGYHWTAGDAGELPLVLVTDRAGHRISFGYTDTGRPASITHSGGYRIRVVMERERVAALALASDEPGQEVTLVKYCYNPAGDLAAVIDSAEQALRFRYDEEGRLTGWDDRNGICFQYSHDEQSRCVAGRGPDGAMSDTFSYGDQVTWRTDAAGAMTIYQLDKSSRVASVTDPLGHVTHFWHDEFGRLVSQADPLGRLSRYSYDERGNLSCVTRPDGS
jgi:YD repeat-containing protein